MAGWKEGGGRRELEASAKGRKRTHTHKRENEGGTRTRTQVEEGRKAEHGEQQEKRTRDTTHPPKKRALGKLRARKAERKGAGR